MIWRLFRWRSIIVFYGSTDFKDTSNGRILTWATFWDTERTFKNLCTLRCKGTFEQ